MGNSLTVTGAEPLKNPRRERFAQLIAAGRAQREAYEQAGYSSRGSVASRNVKAHELRVRADVTERIAYLQAEVAREAVQQGVGLLKERALRDGSQRLREQVEEAVLQGAAVLREAALIAGADPTDYVWGEDGRLRTVEGVAPAAMRAVSSVKRRVRRSIRDDGTVEEVEHQEFKLWDKPKAIQLLGQHLRLWQEQLGVLLGARVEIVLVDEGRGTALATQVNVGDS